MIIKDREEKYLVKIVKRRKLVGRGDKTAGRGTKGQKARKSGHVRLGFEGGQTPVYLRFRKHGDKNGRRIAKLKLFKILNLTQIENDEKIKDDSELDLSNKKWKFKVLGKGQLTKKLKIKAAHFSKSAIEKISEKGGEVIWKK